MIAERHMRDCVHDRVYHIDFGIVRIIAQRYARGDAYLNHTALRPAFQVIGAFPDYIGGRAVPVLLPHLAPQGGEKQRAKGFFLFNGNTVCQSHKLHLSFLTP